MRAMLYGYNSFTSSKTGKAYVSLSFLFESGGYAGFRCVEQLAEPNIIHFTLTPTLLESGGKFTPLPIEIDFDNRGRLQGVYATSNTR